MGWHTYLDMVTAAAHGETVQSRDSYMAKNAKHYGILSVIPSEAEGPPLVAEATEQVPPLRLAALGSGRDDGGFWEGYTGSQVKYSGERFMSVK